jgi:hypothetical protein
MRNNLAEWEESLRSYFEHIKLLGEIPITHIELEQLGNLIRDLIKRYGGAKATRKFETDYRRTFALFLATVAAHNTDRDYWRVVSEAAGISVQRMQQLEWGANFLRILGDFSLPTFQEVGGYRYVTPIRLHGGIPAYSLPDFFAYILWPSVSKDLYKRAKTEKLLPKLLKRSTMKILVDSPVINFLENGGEYALEFFDRCRKMARLYKQSQEVPAPDEIDLPPYVVRTFQQWVDEELETAKGTRLRAPRMYLDPWGPDFYLHLPPESVDALLSTRSFFWRVEMQEKGESSYEHIERVRVHRRGYDLETSEVQLPLEKPASKMVVTYCYQERGADDQENQAITTLRRWRIDLFPSLDQLPLIVFSPNNGRMLRWNQTLPAEELWLLYPSDFELKVEGEGRVVESFPDLNSSYGQWNVQSWDLKKSTSVQLKKGEKAFRAPIPVLSVPPNPTLVGDNLLDSDVDPDDVPLFVGSPPWLRVPIRPGRNVESELAEWRLNVESRWAASPKIHHEVFQLTHISATRQEGPDAVDWPFETILGDKARGTYHVVATGPYHVRKEFRFRVWPKLTLNDLEAYYIPGSEGAEKVKFSIDLPGDRYVVPQAGVETVYVTGDGDHFQVTVDPEVTVADLHLVAPLPEGDPIRLPLSLAIPRLRWSLLLGQSEANINWSASPIKSTVGALLQAERRSLFLDFPIVDELPFVLNVVLVNPENGAKLQEHSRPQEVHFRKTRWRFPLGEFSDTIRHLDEQSVFEFQLIIRNTQTGDTIDLPVLRLSRELEIYDVQIDFLGKREFRLRWVEPKPLRNRRVRIWSEWQPWLKPIEINIPDGVRGELLVPDIKLPPSYYRLQFFTAAPWEKEDPPQLPPKECHLVKGTDPDEMLAWIDERLASNPDHFLLHFFAACVLEAAQDIQHRDAEIGWCYRNMESAAPKNILAFYKWLGGHQPHTSEIRDVNTQKAVRISMFHPKNLNRLLQSHPKGDPVRAEILDTYPNISLVKPESALIMLEQDDDPTRVMHSMQILIRRQSPKAIVKIIEFIESGNLSEHDAGELLSLKPEFTLPALGDEAESPIKLRLIRCMVRLVPNQEHFVLQGFWVRTSAGWGHIQKITSTSDNSELVYFKRKTESPLLSVVLRPDCFPERVEIDLETRIITFLDVDQVYLCTKDDCYYFASKQVKFIRNKHNRASHEGIGPAFRPSSPCFHMYKPEIYNLDPPEDPFE